MHHKPINSSHCLLIKQKIANGAHTLSLGGLVRGQQQKLSMTTCTQRRASCHQQEDLHARAYPSLLVRNPIFKNQLQFLWNTMINVKYHD